MVNRSKKTDAERIALDEKRHELDSQVWRESVETILNSDYADLIVQATMESHGSTAFTQLVDALVSDSSFKSFPVHNDDELATQYIQELVGTGIIPKILSEYPNVTDISYNGRFLSVEDNKRKFIYARSGKEEDGLENAVGIDGKPLAVIDDEYIKKLVTRFANRENKSFTESNPIFNGFSNNMRLSATFETLSATGITMSLRISRPVQALNDDNFNLFAPMPVLSLLRNVVLAHNNVIISGETGTGKTELLKLLMGVVPYRDKIIMVEDVAETHLPEIYPDKDIYDWLTATKDKHDGKDGQTGITIADHVKNALRNMPRWLLVSETRGAEAYEMFQAVLSGHNIVTTLHALNNQAVPSRFVGMSSMGGFPIPTNQLREDFYRYMGFGIHIRRKIFPDGRILRYLQEIVHYDANELSSKFEGTVPIFQQTIEYRDGHIYRRYRNFPLQPDVKQQIKLANNLSDSEMYNLWKPTLELIDGNVTVVKHVDSADSNETAVDSNKKDETKKEVIKKDKIKMAWVEEEIIL